MSNICRRGRHGKAICRIIPQFPYQRDTCELLGHKIDKVSRARWVRDFGCIQDREWGKGANGSVLPVS